MSDAWYSAVRHDDPISSSDVCVVPWVRRTAYHLALGGEKGVTQGDVLRMRAAICVCVRTSARTARLYFCAVTLPTRRLRHVVRT